jgi:hypothetical protein
VSRYKDRRTIAALTEWVPMLRSARSLRRFPLSQSRTMSTGIVVGVSPDGQHSSAAPSVSSQWKASAAKPKAGELRVFYDIQGKQVAAVGTGKPADSDYAKKEQTRKTVSIPSPRPGF